MSNQADHLEWLWECDDPSHQHASWEEADCCVWLLPLLAQLQCASSETALSYALPLGADNDTPPALMLNPDGTYSQIYTRLQNLYESVGQPDGSDEAGFWKWVAKKSDGAAR